MLGLVLAVIALICVVPVVWNIVDIYILKCFSGVAQTFLVGLGSALAASKSKPSIGHSFNGWSDQEWHLGVMHASIYLHL